MNGTPAPWQPLSVSLGSHNKSAKALVKTSAYCFALLPDNNSYSHQRPASAKLQVNSSLLATMHPLILPPIPRPPRTPQLPTLHVRPSDSTPQPRSKPGPNPKPTARNLPNSRRPHQFLTSLHYLRSLPPSGKLIHLWIFSCVASSPVCLCTYWLWYLPCVLESRRKQRAQPSVAETTLGREKKEKDMSSEATTIRGQGTVSRAQESSKAGPESGISRIFASSPHGGGRSTRVLELATWHPCRRSSWPKRLSPFLLRSPTLAPASPTPTPPSRSSILQQLVRSHRFDAPVDESENEGYDDSEEDGALFLALWANDRIFRMLWDGDGSSSKLG